MNDTVQMKTLRSQDRTGTGTQPAERRLREAPAQISLPPHQGLSGMATIHSCFPAWPGLISNSLCADPSQPMHFKFLTTPSSLPSPR